MAKLNNLKLSLVVLNLSFVPYIIYVLFHLRIPKVKVNFTDRQYSSISKKTYSIYGKLNDTETVHFLRPLKLTVQSNNMQYHYVSNQSLYQDSSQNDQQHSNKVVLFWTPQHWFVDWVGKQWDTSHVFSKCSVSNCVLTKRREQISTADAVVYRSRIFKHCQEKQKRGQVWILFEHEPPTKMKKNKYCHRNIFNWTMTYRRDADFTLVHGHFSNAPSFYNESKLEKIFRNKTKTAVAFISHCPTQSIRLAYIKKLRRHGVDVDIYGRCGQFRCLSGLDRKGVLKSVWDVSPNLTVPNDCFEILDSRYKFYLSFANSLCADYVTEKSLHLVLSHNIVPIIRDAVNHSLFHPPNSYLDTKDFKSITPLVNRIETLSRDFDEYKKYFHWKKYFSSENIGGLLQKNLCEICKRLHNPQKYQRQYRNLTDFFQLRSPNSRTCHFPTDL